jgi:hypothetical protein
VDAAIWTAVSYCRDLRGDPTQICIEAGAGGIDKRLSRKIQALGAKVVGVRWIADKTLSSSMMYLEVDDLTWVTRQRAKIQIYIAEPMDSDAGRRLETVGSLFIDRKGGKWIVDGSADGLRTIS